MASIRQPDSQPPTPEVAQNPGSVETEPEAADYLAVGRTYTTLGLYKDGVLRIGSGLQSLLINNLEGQGNFRDRANNAIARHGSVLRDINKTVLGIKYKDIWRSLEEVHDQDVKEFEEKSPENTEIQEPYEPVPEDVLILARVPLSGLVKVFAGVMANIYKAHYPEDESDEFDGLSPEMLKIISYNVAVQKRIRELPSELREGLGVQRLTDRRRR